MAVVQVDTIAYWEDVEQRYYSRAIDFKVVFFAFLAIPVLMAEF